MRTTCSTAVEASHVIPVTIQYGRLYAVTVTFDPALATGTYYLAVLDAAAAPNNSVNITVAPYVLIASKIAAHTNGAAEDVNIDLAVPGTASVSGVQCRTGAVALLSSTALTSITKTPHGWFNGGFE